MSDGASWVANYRCKHGNDLWCSLCATSEREEKAQRRKDEIKRKKTLEKLSKAELCKYVTKQQLVEWIMEVKR